MGEKKKLYEVLKLLEKSRETNELSSKEIDRKLSAMELNACVVSKEHMVINKINMVENTPQDRIMERQKWRRKKRRILRGRWERDRQNQ